MLHLVDPWVFADGEVKISQEEMDLLYESVVKRFAPETESGQVVIHRKFSHEIANLFGDNSLDWVYIDGDHSYEVVKEDLELASKMVKHGGIISGDDYSRYGWPGIKRAVDEFARKPNIHIDQIKQKQYILRKK